MRDDDPSLDSALSALSGVEPPGLEDDDRWAKRVASRVSTFAPPSRRELDPFLAPPFPDDHRDFDGIATDADDHGHAADHTAAAADFGDARGWEGSMSDDEFTSRPPNSLAALSGLTRSGPATADSIEGAAKGDDSGLIDLRAMSQPEPEPEPVAPVAAAAAVPVSEPAAPVSIGKPAAEAASPKSAPKIAVASTASANAAAVAPSSTSATAATAAAAAPRAPEKKGGAGMWIALGGLAAAAAAAFFFVGPMAKKDEASTASAPAAAQPEAKKEEKVAAVEQQPAPTAVEPQASAAPAPTEEPAAAPTVAAKPGTVTGGTAAKVGVAAAPDPKAAPTTKTPEPAPTAETPKSAGTGSLDEVLGIGKDQPAKKVEAADNLPDKPDSMDVRSAINGKLSAANACVKGLEGPSNASVTFGPSGAVSGVVITSGPAKGTGAESCVKSAFSAAKVPPSKKGASGSATLMP